MLLILISSILIISILLILEIKFGDPENFKQLIRNVKGLSFKKIGWLLFILWAVILGIICLLALTCFLSLILGLLLPIFLAVLFLIVLIWFLI